MPVYTVHAPSCYGVDVRATPDRFVFIRDGFYFWAFVASVVWLAWHRLWVVLFGYVVLTVAAEVAMSWFGIGAGARMLMMLIVAALVGLEAGSLWRWTLRRRKWQQLDVVVADDEEAAERRFFDRWSAGVNGEPGRATPSPLPPLPRASLGGNEVLGSFPQPGVPR
jgi:hypothetical protein